MNSLELKGERVRHGFTQKMMATNLEISPSSYANKENGKLEFTDSEKLKIAEMFAFSYRKVNDVFFDGKLPYDMPASGSNSEAEAFSN